MTRLVIDVLLVLVVLVVWLGCVGFARLRDPFDRQHCVAFVNTAAGLALVVIAFVADGPSVRAFKIVLIVAVSLVAGSAMSHALGRALVRRGDEPGGQAPT